jgi:ATP-binding cassette subfamily C protein CydD
MLHKQLLAEAISKSRLLALITAVNSCGGLLTVLQAYYLALSINAVFLEGAAVSAITNWLAILAAVILCRSIVVWWGDILAHRLALTIQTELRQRLLQHLLALGPVMVSRQPSGSMVNLLTEGIENLEPYFARYLPQIITSALIPLFILLFVFYQDMIAALLLLLTAPLIPFFMVLIGKAAEKLNKKQWEKLSYLSSHFLDVLQGLTTLKVFGRSKEQAAVIARMSDDFRDTTLQVLRVAFLSALALELIATISTALVAVTVGLKLLFGDLVFTQAFFVLLLAPEYYLPLRLLGTHFHAGMAGAAAAEQIYRILAIPVLSAGGPQEPFPRQSSISLSFDSVSYSYQTSGEWALKGLEFAIRSGERVAVVGESGAGKTTIANLLLRFIRPNAGAIKINDRLLDELSCEDWLRHVAYVPQAPHLFSGTIADNIAFGGSYSREAIAEAAKQAGAHAFIEQLPQGYQTIVGEGGRSLSGGERQRLAIARAFLLDAPLILLDEATASLDPYSENVISIALEKLFQGRTVIIIAHRLSTISRADRIIVLEQGQVAEIGKHDELIKRDGVYSRLVTAFRGVQ